MPDFLPRRNADFLAWSGAFRDRIVSQPQAYSLTPEQAQDYSELHDSFAVALQRSTAPTTDSTSARLAAREARAAVEARARVLARVVRASPSVTAEGRQSLGLGVAGERSRHVGKPEAAPAVHVVSAAGRTVQVRLSDPSAPTRRARAAGAAGMTLFTHVGDHPPRERSGWAYRGITTRLTATIKLDPDVEPGQTVWVSAAYFNPRGEAGPMAAPASARLSYPLTFAM